MLTAMAVGAGIGALGSLSNTGLSFGLNQYSSKKAAKKAYQYWRQSQLEGPSLMRQGLVKAGYNPMLALSQGSSSFNQGVSAPNTQVGDFVGSAREGAQLAKEAVKSAKAQIANIEADTKLKEGQLSAVETQRLQTEANTALLHSQVERSDLAYGRDIVDTALGIAGTGASLYSAKAMSDVAKANAAVNARNADVNARNQLLKESGRETSRTVQRYDKHGKLISSDEISESVNPMKKAGVPIVEHTANPRSKANAVGLVGSSAKSGGSVAKQVALDLILPAALFLGKKFALPAAVAGAAYSAYGDEEKRKRTSKHYERAYKDKPYSYSPLR